MYFFNTVKLMTLDLKNVIGSFMLGSVIMYAFNQNTPCVSKSAKVTLKLNSTKKSDLRFNKTLKNQRTFTLTLIQHPSENNDNRTKFNNFINIEGAYIDRKYNGQSLIIALAHILWYKQKKVRYSEYVEFFQEFNKQFTLKLSLEAFILKYKLCKLKDIIFLHPSNANSITFDTQNKGFFKGLITETTPYIVNVGNNFFPGVGKLNSRMIDLIIKSYTDITDLQETAPIEIDCSKSVRFGR